MKEKKKWKGKEKKKWKRKREIEMAIKRVLDNLLKLKEKKRHPSRSKCIMLRINVNCTMRGEPGSISGIQNVLQSYINI